MTPADTEAPARRTVTLTATSDPGNRGKQFVAKILGLSSRSRAAFAMRYLGNSHSHVSQTTTEADPGLYVVRDVERARGIRSVGGVDTDTYFLVWIDDGSAVATQIEEVEAHGIAAALDSNETAGSGHWQRLGRASAIARHERMLAEHAERPNDRQCKVRSQIGALEPGVHASGDIRRARQAEIARLRGESAALPIEIDASPSDPAHARRALEDERARLLARVAEIDAELNGAEGTQS